METKKASVIVFDIETYSTRDAQILEEIRDAAVKKRPAQNTLKEIKGAWGTTEARAARGAEAVAKTALDPMLAAVLVVAYSVDGVNHVTEVFASHEAERAGLENLAEDWDAIMGPDTLLVGHNIAGFDMPVLIGAWNRHDIEPPDFFPRFSRGRFHGNYYDTMQQIPNNNAGFVSLDTACRALGLPSAKSCTWEGLPMTGARVAEAFERAQFELLQEYCLADVEAELRLFLRLTHGGSYGLSRRSDSVREALEPIWASETLDRAQKKIASFDALRQLGVIPQGIAV
jgi:hypothetical protein